MWINFGTTFNVCLGWLQGRYVLAAILGAAAGPLTRIRARRRRWLGSQSIYIIVGQEHVHGLQTHQ